MNKALIILGVLGIVALALYFSSEKETSASTSSEACKNCY